MLGFCQTVSPAAAAVFVVDQFEEVFTLCTDAVRRAEFIDRLLDLAGRAS